jgi:hypothetical protein
MRSFLCMMSFEHYDELKAILSRMDTALPKGQPSLTSHSQSWKWNNTVIQAKSISQHQLLLPNDSWKFKGVIPSTHQQSASRRWYISEQTRTPTNMLMSCSRKAITLSLPNGLSLWHGTDSAKRLFILAKHDAKQIFDSSTERMNLPIDNNWTLKGYVTLFSTPGPTQISFADSIRLLRPLAPYLSRLAEEYARSLCQLYDLETHEFERLCYMHISLYKQGVGLPMCLTNASPCRFENGPVVHVGLGKPIIEHDLAPTLGDPSVHELPVRVIVPEGVMVCMDGVSRMRYSHGHPANSDNSCWFSLTFFLDCTKQSRAVGFEMTTRTIIMQTPLSQDHVVPNPSFPKPIQGVSTGLVSSTVLNMRQRLKMAESYLLASRYEPMGSMGMAENSSSRNVRE